MVDQIAEELRPDLGGSELAGQMILKADERSDLLRQIQMLDQHAFRQEQISEPIQGFLEANVTRQS